MHDREQPRARFSLDTTREEYVAASLFADRRAGSLRALPATVLTAAALLALGLFSFGWLSSPLLPLLLCLVAPLLLLLILLVQPATVRRQAAADYDSYHKLMENAVLALYSDEAETTAAHVTFTDPYALLTECIETPELLVLLKDRERFFVIPKRCLPPEKREELLSFFRQVFARKRRAMRSWVW